MTKIISMSAREFLEDTYRPRPESRQDLAELVALQESNRKLLEQEQKKFRRFTTVIGALVALVFVGLLMLNIYEQQHMTDAQRETLSHTFN